MVELDKTRVSKQGDVVKVDAAGLTHQQLNTLLRQAMANGARKLEIHNVHGQRYIGTDLEGAPQIDIYGTPGNDLGAFMDGPSIRVHGNAQDGCGNTMNEGVIVVDGHAGDITGLSARGGKIFVRGYVGYRAAIHMKEYQEKKPALVIGGMPQDFVGEYMAGGVVIVLGMHTEDGVAHRPRFIGTGMHGGVIYWKGEVEKHEVGKEVGVKELDENDRAVLRTLVGEFAGHFGLWADDLLAGKFIKL